MDVSAILSQYFPRLVLACLAVLALGLLFRLLFGPGSALNHALCCAMGIGMVYVLSVVIYTFRPAYLTGLLSPLPFVSFRESALEFFPFLTAPLEESCSQVLSMVILAFLVCLTDSIMPQSHGILGWVLSRFLNVLLAMGAHYLVLQLLATFAAGFIASWAPAILLGLLLVFLSLGFLKLVLGLVLTVINPLLGAVYAFFFSSLLGKQLSKAVLATAVLLALMVALEKAGIHSLPIHIAALRSYIPTAAALAGVWFLIGHKL